MAEQRLDHFYIIPWIIPGHDLRILDGYVLLARVFSLEYAIARLNCITAYCMHVRTAIFHCAAAHLDGAFSPPHSRTEGLSSADVLRVCSQAASQSQPKPRAKWGGQQAELGSSAVAGGGEGGCSVLRMVHFDSALARVKPCMSDTEAAAYAKWKPGASL